MIKYEYYGVSYASKLGYGYRSHVRKGNHLYKRNWNYIDLKDRSCWSLGPIAAPKALVSHDISRIIPPLRIILTYLNAISTYISTLRTEPSLLQLYLIVSSCSIFKFHTLTDLCGEMEQTIALIYYITCSWKPCSKDSPKRLGVGWICDLSNACARSIADQAKSLVHNYLAQVLCHPTQHIEGRALSSSSKNIILSMPS